MDETSKKIALRMIPYGIYVLTAKTEDGEVAAATVNWVTQTSFDPPMLVVALKADSAALRVVEKAGHFALNMLGKGQQSVAFGFFKPAEHDGERISGEPYHPGATGAPLLEVAQAAVECRVAEIVARGDHHVVVAEVVEAHVHHTPEGRPDAAILEMKDLGDNVFYGG